MARTDSVMELKFNKYITSIGSQEYDFLIKGDNSYLNWGSVNGSTGYGIRANAGRMEFKHVGGVWTEFGSGGGGSPGGSTTQLQYNNAGAFGGISGATSNGTVVTLTDGVNVVSTPTTTSIGYLGIPQNSQSANYTAVITDAGKQLFHPSADTSARTFTIPANASVAYPIGTVLTFINQNGGGDITIAITTDTMRLVGTGATGSQTLPANYMATAVKVTSTEWLLSLSTITAGANIEVGSTISALTSTINPSQITAWQNDYAPTSIGTASVINLDADTSFPFITGITATGMSDGEIKIFNNDGSNAFGFKDNSTASTAGNRFIMGKDVILLPNRNVAFRYDTTNTCWRLVGNSPDIPREYYSQDYWNPMFQKTNDGIFNWWTSGSGASNNLNVSTTFQSSHPGVVTSSTGTTTSGYAQTFGNDASNPNKVMTVTKGYTEFNAMVYFDNLSDGTDTYTYKMGLVNAYSSSTGQTEEVTIGYSSGINSGKWFLRTQAGSTTTDVDSGIAVVADTWYHIRWVCYDGDKVHFWINGTYGGESTTNIPTATIAPIHSIWKTAGTTARTVDADYFGFKIVNYTA